VKIQLIRNATMRLDYAGQTLLTDPMLSPKGALMSFAGRAWNPTVDLPISAEEVVRDVDGLLVSHPHPDHLDKAAVAALPKDLPVLCQLQDATGIKKHGFQDVTAVETSLAWNGVTITRTNGKHGEGLMGRLMGSVSGFVLQAENEPSVYWIGDSVWCEAVAQAIKQFKPDVIITHSGGARFPLMKKPIIMDAEQTIAVAKAAPEAVVVAVHLEALDHCRVNRTDLRRLAETSGIETSRLRIPTDGESLTF
jgi:L-ascorbate metabolism protein UlaG (beta-lactamase superfamily)